LATFAELAGMPALAASDGVSLLPSLTGKGQRRPSTLYVEYFNDAKTPDFQEFAPAHRGKVREQMQTIFLDGYKGIRYDVKSAEDDFGIFNLSQDPQEAHNLAGDGKFSGLQTAMKARVLQVRKPNASAKRPYDDALVPPVAHPASSDPGVTWSLFSGEWPWMPDFRTLTPASTGTSRQIELAMAPSDRPFGVAFDGYFVAPRDGDYSFAVDADAGAMLFLHDIRVIDEPRIITGSKLSGSVRLTAGWHPLRLLYRHGTGEPRLVFTCQSPGGEPVKVGGAELRQAEHRTKN
jgi:hypothetical protein